MSFLSLEGPSFNDRIEIPLPVDRILYETIAPIVHLSHTHSGVTLLAFHAFEDAQETSILLTPVSPQQIDDLERGVAGLREVLTSGLLWRVRILHASSVFEGRRVNPDLVPPRWLPVPGALLHPFT